MHYVAHVMWRVCNLVTEHAQTAARCRTLQIMALCHENLDRNSERCKLTSAERAVIYLRGASCRRAQTLSSEWKSEQGQTLGQELGLDDWSANILKLRLR